MTIPDLIKATEGATEGPWEWEPDYRGLEGVNSSVLIYDRYEGMHVPSYTDEGKKSATLIAAAPTFRAEVIRLMEENERLRGENSSLRYVFSKLDEAISSALKECDGQDRLMLDGIPYEGPAVDAYFRMVRLMQRFCKAVLEFNP